MRMDRRLYWPAFAALVGFMLVWGMTPVGGAGDAFAARLGLENGWAWPFGGLSFFWLVYGGLWLIRRWRQARAGSDSAAGN